MTEYVLGFALCKDYANFYRVLLIRKTKPDWQEGKLNGLGGKIEPTDLTPAHAMAREFCEGCGLPSEPQVWWKFATMKFALAEVHCFVSWWDWKTFKRAASTTEEKVCHYEIDERFVDKMKEEQALSNISWLAPMALAYWKNGSAPLTIIEQ